MAEFYYLIGEDRHGPISAAKLKSLAGDGTIFPDTKICKAGMDKWIPAAVVKGLFPTAPTPPKAKAPTIPPPPRPVAEQKTPPPQTTTPEPAPPIPESPVAEIASETLPPSQDVPSPEAVPVAEDATPVSDPSASTTTPAPTAPQKKRPWLTIIFGSLAGLLIVGMACTIAFLIANQPKPDALATRHEELKEEIAKLEEVIDELKADEDTHEAETKDAKSQLEDVLDEIQKKEKEREAVEQEIARLVSYREELKGWQNIDIALANPTEYAAGLKFTPDGVKLVMSATDKTARDALSVVRNAGIVRMSRDRGLTRKLVNTGEVDVRVPKDLEEKIREIYRPHRFLKAGPNEDPMFVSFFDLEQNRMRFGAFIEANNSELVVQTVSEKAERLPKVRIREGSVRVGTSNQLAATLSERNFLDYLILNVAHKLGSEWTGEGTDERKLLLPGTEVLDPNKMYRPEYISLAIHCEADHLESPADRIRLMKYTHKSTTIDRDGNLTQTKTKIRIPIVPRRHIPESIRQNIQRVEDEVYSRASSVGLPIIENELPDGYSIDDKFEYVEGPLEAADRRHATHLLSLQMQKPKGGGEYFLSARLVRIRDRRVLWATTGGDFLSEDLIEQPYHMNSGDLALFHFEEDTFAKFPGIEKPNVARPIGIAPPDSRYSYLVYSEHYDPIDEFVSYRMPFSKMPYSSVRRVISKFEPIHDSMEVPRHLVLRYAACRSCSKLMPAAGRVLEVNGHEATVGIGRADGVLANQKLAVFRVNRELKEKFQKMQSWSYGSDEFGSTPVLDERSFTESRTLLPQEVIVKEVFDRHSRVYVTETGMEQYWGETAGQLLANDIVTLNKKKSLRVKFVSYNDGFPLSKDLSLRLGFARNPNAVRNAYEPSCRRAKEKVITQLMSSFTSQNVPVLTKNSDNSATHEVIVSVKLSDNMHVLNKQNTSKPTFRVSIGIRPTGSTKMIDQFEFDLAHHIL